MARALRRTLSAHIQEENLSSSGRGSVNSGFIMQIGGRGGRGGGVCAVSSSQRDLQGSHVSSLMSLSSGVAGGTGGLTGSSSTGNLLPNSSSILDGLFNLNKLAMIVPSSWLRIMARPSSMDRPGKSKGTLYRRPMMQLLLSFVLGLVLGFTPISWSGFTFARDDPRDDFAIEVNGFVTNLQREGSQSGEKLIELESEKSAVGLGHDGAGLNPDVDITDGMSGSKLDVSGANLLDIPPGLNFTKDPQRKLLIVVTPTYNRAFQVHFLTRLAHILRLVSPPLLWLVVEAPGQSLETASLLRQTGIMYRHLVCNENLTNVKDRGIYQRNVALKHIEIHQLDGVVYFADDDNVYSLELFEQLRRIKRFGTWPVGMMAESKAKAVVEGPVCDGEKVIGWHTNEKSKRLRRFHVDMSGFGFNSTILWDTKHWRHRSSEPIRQLEVKEGFQETTFIEQLVEDESQMEGLPSGCNKIMVWHLHLEAPGLTYPSGWSLPQPLESNIPFRS